MRNVHVGLSQIKGRKKPWRLRWKPRNAKGRTCEFHFTKAEALRRKKEIEDFENGHRDLSSEIDYQEIREIKLKLKQTDNSKAKGKSVSFAIEWFLENYQGGDELQELKFYYKEYIKIKSRKASIHSIRTDDQMIGLKGKDAFVRIYGHMKPTEFTREFIQSYLDSKSSIFHREKALRAFFTWMRGKSKFYHNDYPCLLKNPMNGVSSGKAKKDFTKAVATNQEVCDLLRLANTKEYNFSAARWAFMFFTGMRPKECERFWDPKNKVGWSAIALHHKEPIIIIDRRVIQKNGPPTRQIKIRKGFLEMLKAFKKGGEKKYPMNVKNWKRVHSDLRKRIWGERLTISTKLDEAKDIARHTFVSNLYLYADSMALITGEAGDSESTIRKHYLNAMISPNDAKNFFQEIGISALKEKIVINEDQDLSPLSKIIQNHGEGILNDERFLSAWTGQKRVLGIDHSISREERIQMLEDMRRKKIRGGPGLIIPKSKASRKRGGQGLKT